MTTTQPLSLLSTQAAASDEAHTLMKAVVATGYGSTDVLQLAERAKPTPGEHDLLVRVHAANVSAADSMMRRGDPAYARLFLGVMRPKSEIPGTGFAGTIEAVGSAVSEFRVGDEVFGETAVSFGAHAEYVCIADDSVVLHKPQQLRFEHAAAMCDGPVTSLNFLKRMAELEPGQKVLIVGASGSLGSAAVQIAKAYGAEVTGVCSTANVALVASLGADHVIDYRKEDFTRSERSYDVIYDSVGKSSFGDSKRVLAADGQYLSPVLGMALLFNMLLTSVFGSKKARFDATGLRPADELRAFLRELVNMVVTNKLRIVTERVYPFEQIAEAHAHVDTGRKKGNVMVRMVEDRPEHA